MTEGPFDGVFATFETKCPAYIPSLRWQGAVRDGRTFLGEWDRRARKLGWTRTRNGLIWLLRGQRVVELSERTAVIRNLTTGKVTNYRKYNKPAYGPLGDCLDDFTA